MTLSESKSFEIYEMKKSGVSNSEIMKEFKISYSELQSAINYWEKKNKKHFPVM